MPHQKPNHEEPALATERRLQVGAALALGVAVLVGAVLRAGVRTVFSAGWWRHW